MPFGFATNRGMGEIEVKQISLKGGNLKDELECLNRDGNNWLILSKGSFAGLDKGLKSKLEKETGTVNDRIFEVLPNYGTVENANALPALTSGQKFRLATASVFDWGAYPFNAALAAISQAKNDPKEWGQGLA